MSARLPLRNQFSRRTSKRRRQRLAFESLEPRFALSAGGIASPNTILLPATSAGAGPFGYTPAQIRTAYGFDQISFTSPAGAWVPGNGAGQTIAIVDAYNDPNIAADLAVFSQRFALPQFNVPGGPTLKVTSQTGSTTALPLTDPGWAVEIALDVEWAHAIAPYANILLVESNTDDYTDLLLAVNRAKVQPGVSVVSMSWGGNEFASETSWDPAFLARRTNAGETFVAASGDEGSPPEWPAISPNVLSVGGTTLNLAGNAYVSETAWSGSTGGVASYESEPLYQYRVQNTGLRSNPDVAYVGDPNTGMAVYDSVPADGQVGWVQIAGTSIGAPQWGALIAIANQGRALKGLAPLNAAQSLLYSLPATDFHDITSGNNGGYTAGPGYDGVTGLGSPVANLVIQHLVNGVPYGLAPPELGNTGIVRPAALVQHAMAVLPGAVREASGATVAIAADITTGVQNGGNQVTAIDESPAQTATGVPGEQVMDVIRTTDSDGDHFAFRWSATRRARREEIPQPLKATDSTAH